MFLIVLLFLPSLFKSMFNINNLKLSFYWTIYWNQPSSKKLQFEEFSQLKQKVQQQKQAV